MRKKKFVLKFLEYVNKMCDVKFKEIIWYYAEWQNWYSSYPQVCFEERLFKSNFSNINPRLIIIDDLMR